MGTQRAGQLAGNVLARAYQRVVDRLSTPTARVPTESVQIQNVPQMVTMGTQSEHGGMNVFQQTAGGKNTLVKYKPEVYGPGENPTEFKMNPIMEERMKNVRGIGGLFEEDVPNVKAGRGSSQIPKRLAADIFDMTRDSHAPALRASASSVPPPKTRDVSGEGATSAASELAGLMAVQVQQQQDKFKKTGKCLKRPARTLRYYLCTAKSSRISTIALKYSTPVWAISNSYT